MSDTDQGVVNPGQPLRMPDQTAVDNWRHNNPVQDPAQTADREAMQAQQAANALRQEHERYHKQEEGMVGRVGGAYGDLAKSTANIPQQQPLPPRPDAKEYEKNSGAFVASMAVLGAIGHHFGRVNSTGALGAFAGALNGWKEGNLSNYEEAAKKWEQDTKATIESNRQLMQKYKAVLESKQLNIDGMMAQIKLLAAEHHDDIAYQLAQSQNITAIAALQDKRYKETNNVEKNAAELKIGDTMRQSAQIGAAVSTGQIDPDGNNPATGQPFSEKEKVNMKIAKERFESGFYDPWLDVKRGKGAAGGVTGVRMSARNEMIQNWMRSHPDEGYPSEEVINGMEAERASVMTESRQTASRAGSLEIVAVEAENTLPNIRRLAQANAGRGTAFWDSVENKWKVQKGDAGFAEYVQQLNAGNTLYSRLIAGGGKPTVTDREHAREEIFNPNMPFTAIEGSLKGVEFELGVAREAPEKARQRIYARHGWKMDSGEGAEGGGGGGAPKPGTTLKYDAQGNPVQ
jgi:hypothetical protein